MAVWGMSRHRRLYPSNNPDGLTAVVRRRFSERFFVGNQCCRSGIPRALVEKDEARAELSAPFPRPAQYLSLAGVDAIKAIMFPHWHRRSAPPPRRSVPGTDRLCLKHQHHQAVAAPGYHSLLIAGKAREAAWRRARSRRPAGRRASCIVQKKFTQPGRPNRGCSGLARDRSSAARPAP